METNKRGFIKNLIIIFLVLILIFTLFSNTFMNRSLPEVAVSNSESGTITTQVKLTGTVNANSVKQITLEYARKIDEVLVRRGDTVSPGTVLATLVAGESAEIDNLEIELKQLQIEYKKLQIEAADALVTTRYQLEDAEKELADLNTYLEEYPTFEAKKQEYEDKIKAIKEQIKAYESAVETREEEVSAKQDEMDAENEIIKDLQKQIDKLAAAGAITGKPLDKLGKEIKDAEEALKDAEKDTRRAKSNLTIAENASSAAASRNSSAAKAWGEAKAALTNAQKAVDDLNATLNELSAEQRTLNKRIKELKSIAEEDRTEEEKQELADKTARLDAVEDEMADTEASITKAETARDSAATAEQTAAQAASEASTAASSAAQAALDASSAYTQYQAKEETAQKTLDTLNDSWGCALLEARRDERQETYDALEKEQTLMNKDIAKMKKDNEKLATQKSELETERDEFTKENMAEELDAAEKKKTELTRSIEEYKTTIRIAEANGEIDDETAALNLSIQRTKIAQKQREIEKLREKAVSTEIKSTVSGTVSTLSMTAGDEIAANTTVAEIATSDGYTMECSVPNAQASRLRTGLVGEVQYYYWGDKPTVTVQTIKNDPNNSGKSKIVTLTVDGDVADGTSLTVTIGSQGSSYDCIVPNSAIQEDSDGKFILVVTSKSSPLGNRYYAQRKNVTVLASEATRSAIDASLSWGDYVITGATDADGKKIPISDGMQVRMAEK